MKDTLDKNCEMKSNYILPLNSKLELNNDFKNKRIVIILHLYYLDTVDKYLKYIEKIPSYIDIIITISNNEIRLKLQKETITKRTNFKIVNKENRGRDISAFLVKCRKEILKYDYICFLHDKKEKCGYKKTDIEKWCECLWENMIGSEIYIENIMKTLEINPNLGLLVPPVPMSEHFTSVYGDRWGKNFNLTKLLSNRMNLKCDLSYEKSPITLGTVFWAKVSAIKKLLEIEWKYEDFDEEPLKDDGTLSHAIERILEYVAQDAGYQTRWVMTDQYAGVRVEYMQETLKKAFNQLNDSLGIWLISELDSYKNRQKELVKFVDKYEHFYIYGAGYYGKKCFSMLKDVQRIPKAFLVSKKYSNPESLYGISVYLLEKVKPNKKSGIIVAVGNKYKEEILNFIRNKGYSNIYLYNIE